MEQEGESRQLKLRGGGLEAVGQKNKGDKDGKEKKHESGGKMWVLIILGVTILASFVFSMKDRQAKVGFSSQESSQIEEKKEERKWSLFGPAEYEFEK